MDYIDIIDILQILQKYNLTDDDINSLYLINNTIQKKADIDTWSLEDLTKHAFMSVPPKLYKFYSNRVSMENGREVNYSHKALLSDRMYLSDPAKFNDPFDCELCVSKEDHYKRMLLYIASQAHIDLDSSFTIESMH